MRNKYCELSNLRNESDVEQFLVIRLLKDLDYDDSRIFTKDKLDEVKIGKGNKKKSYKPDYVISLDKYNSKPIMIIDAKHPNEDVEEGVNDAQLYTSVIRRNLKKPKPEQYCMGINGHKIIVREYESNEDLFNLNFEDLVDDNNKFKKLKKELSFDSLKNNYYNSINRPQKFILEKLPRSELNGIFRACHNIIWKKEKTKPTRAFYEFSKLFFVKLYYDREISRYLKNLGRPIKKEDTKIEINKEQVVFCVDYLDREKELTKKENPMNDLFEGIRDELEEKVLSGEKKRIFDKDEQLELSYSTIKYVVELLEGLYLFGIDEELNGRMFEQFLSATIRGKDLGQFFTPRSVVKFMTEMAELKITEEHIDRVLDIFCGSGGFLIEAMSNMFHKVDRKRLTDKQKEDFKDKIVGDYLWGIDADKDKYIPISKVARMNMYLHGDGSNRIYWLPDSLDKDIEIEETNKELKKQAVELKQVLESGLEYGFKKNNLKKKESKKDELKFDVVLTNPPFSMKYESKKQDERKILQRYEIAKLEGKFISSLKSNILSIERYKDLLKPHGKLITIIDESVLNTETAKPFRDYIRKHFIIRAVISLPRNTFINADTTVKTSVLYLIKKEDEGEEQPPIFMGISENVGHSDSGKEDLTKLDLYHEYDDNGEIINKDIKKTILDAYFDFMKNE